MKTAIQYKKQKFLVIMMNNTSPKAVVNALTIKPRIKSSKRYKMKRPFSSHYHRGNQPVANNATTTTVVISQNSMLDKGEILIPTPVLRQRQRPFSNYQVAKIEKTRRPTILVSQSSPHGGAPLLSVTAASTNVISQSRSQKRIHHQRVCSASSYKSNLMKPVRQASQDDR